MIRMMRLILSVAMVLSLLFGLVLSAQAESTISLDDVKQMLGEVPMPTPWQNPSIMVPAFPDAEGLHFGYQEIAGLVEGFADIHAPATKDQVLAYTQKMINYGFAVYDTTKETEMTDMGLGLTFTKGNAKVVLIYSQKLSNVMLIYQQGMDYIKEGAQAVKGGTLVAEGSELTLRVNGAEKAFTLRSATRTMYGEYGSISAIFEHRDSTGALQDQFALAFPATATLGSVFNMDDSASVILTYTAGGAADKPYFATKAAEMDFAANAVRYRPQPSERAAYQLTITDVSADASAFQGTLQATLCTQNGEWVEIDSGSFVVVVE